MPTGYQFYDEEEDPYAQWLTPPGVPRTPPFAPQQRTIYAEPPIPSREAAGMPPARLMPATPAIPAPPPGLDSTPELPQMTRQTISAADPFEGKVERVMDERSRHAGSRPKYTDDQFKRPMWQRLAMAAVNGAAGYVNAGGRAHVATIGQDAINARPKYDAAMEEWQRQGNEIDSDLNKILSEGARRRQNEMDSNRERRDDAYVELQQAHAKHYLEPPTQRQGARYLVTAAGVLDTTTGKIVPGTEPQQKSRTGNRTAEDVLMDPNASDEEKTTAQRIFDAKTRKKGGGASSGVEARFQQQQARMEDKDNRRELADIEKEEYGKGGLHERRSELGRNMAGADPADADVDALNQINNRLRSIYKRKLELGAIDKSQHDRMVGDLKDATPTKWLGSGKTAKERDTGKAKKPAPKKGDHVLWLGADYVFDGSQWVKQ